MRKPPSALAELALAEEPVGESGDTPIDRREWPQPWKGPLLESLARLPNASAACRQVGITRAGFYRAMDTDPDFRVAVREALLVGVDLLEQIAHRRATVGEPKRVVRTRTKRDAKGDIIEQETVEIESVEIDNHVLGRLLEAYRPERYSRDAEARRRGEERPSTPADDGDAVYRPPTRERMRELVLLARELEPDDDVEDAEFSEVPDQ